MGLNTYITDTLVRTGTITPIVATDYRPGYSAQKVRNIWTTYYYRSKYGSGSGWGYFEIDSTNNKLYFVDNGSTARTATITTGTYDADSLIAEIETQMEAQTTDTFTCAYSNSTNKFQITNDVGTYQLTCTNTTNAIWATIGFNTASDKTGSAGYISDYVRIHSAYGIVVESSDSSAVSTTGAALLGLNLTSSYQICKLQRWTGSAWQDIGNFDCDTDNGRAVITYNSTSATKYRVYIRDWTNPAGYGQIGVALIGDANTISRGYEYGADLSIEDTSSHQYSKEGYLNVISGFQMDVSTVEYSLMSTDEAKLEAIYRAIGKQYPFVFVSDSDDPENTMSYVIFRARFARLQEDDYFKAITLAWETVK